MKFFAGTTLDGRLQEAEVEAGTVKLLIKKFKALNPNATRVVVFKGVTDDGVKNAKFEYFETFSC